jgi:DMSO/TMAO reductase YedYZ molybdopterin-dependent catalytic subunit
MSDFKEEIVSTREIRKRTIRSFIVFFVLILLAIGGWKWLVRQPTDNGVPKPLRTALDANDNIFTNYIFSNYNLAKGFSRGEVVPRTRVNGDIGTPADFDTTTWKLQLIRAVGDTQLISLAEIKALPQTEVIFDFKCIEGWDQVTRWEGVKFSDFVKKYNLDQQVQMKYVGLHTPDNKYYVGIDTRSMLQSQTILCYAMNGKPLPMNQGAPLRLIIPVKYGIKHLKLIGTIFFSDQRPPDYWFERGYDYYAGL